jgi:hypothetical protein
MYQLTSSGRAAGLPLAPRPLVGRARAVDEIAHLVVDDRARLVTLTGPGGAGQTRLALAVAERLTRVSRRRGQSCPSFTPSL